MYMTFFVETIISLHLISHAFLLSSEGLFLLRIILKKSQLICARLYAVSVTTTLFALEVSFLLRLFTGLTLSNTWVSLLLLLLKKVKMVKSKVMVCPLLSWFLVRWWLEGFTKTKTDIIQQLLHSKPPKSRIVFDRCCSSHKIEIFSCGATFRANFHNFFSLLTSFLFFALSGWQRSNSIWST